MAQLSDRLNRLAPSATLAMSQKSSEMKAQGIDVINMSVGEPDFNTPDHIKDAAKKAIDDNYSRYSPVPGYMDLREAISAKLKRENGLDYGVNEILVSNGAKQSVCNTVMALVNDGDEVIIPAPYWVSYPQMAKLAGGVPVIVEAGFEQNFKMTPEQPLVYSENCFGTADSICFRNNMLRIHDLKTGVTPAHMEQLMIYTALFCLEYRYKPSDIDIELRIYQNDEILYHKPTAEDIVPIMDKIITFDKLLKRIKQEEE